MAKKPNKKTFTATVVNPASINDEGDPIGEARLGKGRR